MTSRLTALRLLFGVNNTDAVKGQQLHWWHQPSLVLTILMLKLSKRKLIVKDHGFVYMAITHWVLTFLEDGPLRSSPFLLSDYWRSVKTPHVLVHASLLTLMCTKADRMVCHVTKWAVWMNMLWVWTRPWCEVNPFACKPTSSVVAYSCVLFEFFFFFEGGLLQDVLSAD